MGDFSHLLCSAVLCNMGFMDKMKSATQSVKESAKKQTAKTKVAAGSLLSANDVPGKFGLSSDAEPLLVCGKTSLLSGDNTVLKGQIYVTPSYLCILTYSNGNEVTLPLPHSALQS